MTEKNEIRVDQLVLLTEKINALELTVKEQKERIIELEQEVTTLSFRDDNINFEELHEVMKSVLHLEIDPNAVKKIQKKLAELNFKP